MPKYPISQIKSAYTQKRDWERQFLISYYLFRPISFYLAYMVIRITESPGSVAWAGFVIGLLGCFSFLFIPHLTIWSGIVLLIIFALLDAVDGNIARVTKKVNYYGKYLDGVIGVAIEGSYCLWLGFGLYLNPEILNSYTLLSQGYNQAILVLLAGIVIGLGILYSRIFETDYYMCLMKRQAEEGHFQANLKGNIQSSTYRKNRWYLVFINLNAFNLQLILLALCTALRMVDLFLFFFAAYYLFRLIATMTFYSLRAQNILK